MANPIKATVDYIKSSIAELHKVSWPTKDMTIRYSALVMIVCVVVAVFFAALDFGFSNLVTKVLAKNQTVTAPIQQEAIPDVQPIDVSTTGDTTTNDVGIEVDSDVPVTTEPQTEATENTGEVKLPL